MHQKKNRSRMNRLGMIALAIFSLSFFAPANHAQASPIEEGRMMFGAVLGGGTGYFAVGGQFGYFVLDGLRPSLSVVYQTQSAGGLETSEVETTAGLRYYIGIPETSLYPFAETELGVNSLSYEIEGASESFLFYRAGAGGGLLAMLNRNFGLEVALGVDQFFGADPILKDIGFIPEGLAFRYNFGFSVSF